MVFRRIEIAAIVASFAAIPTWVGAEPTNVEGLKSPKLTVATESESEAVEDRATKNSSEAPGVGLPPPTPYVRVNVGSADTRDVSCGCIRSDSAGPTPLALAPDHVGLTTSASPSLFWHIDALPGEEVELVFAITRDQTEPLAEIPLEIPSKIGIQRLRLAELNIELEPEIEYMWSISIVSDAENPSSNPVSTRYIRRVSRPEALATGSLDGENLAKAGLWYDALEAMSDDIDADPGDSRSRFLRSAMLRQAKLDPAVGAGD